MKRSEIESTSSQRSLIHESIKKLSALTLNWYVPSANMKKKMEDLKKGRLFFEYNPLLVELWKNNPKEFDVHYRSLIHSASLTDNHNHVKIGINKGFIDLANSSGRTIDCSQLNKLGSNVSKSLMVRLSMMKKKRVHIETMCDMLLLKQDTPSRSKNQNVKIALERLISIDFLESYELDGDFVNMTYKKIDKNLTK